MKLLKLSLIALVLAFTFACADDGANSGTTGPVINDNPPVITLSTDTINISKDELATTTDNYTVKLQSTAQGGIDNLSVTITSDDAVVNTTLAGLLGGSTLDLADSSNTLVAGMIDAGSLPVIKSKHNIDVTLNPLLATLVLLPINTDTTITMTMRLVDANGEASETLTTNITVPPVIDSNPPVITLSTNTINISLNELATTTDTYTAKLKSTAQGGIDNLTINMSSNNNPAIDAIIGAMTLDLADSSNQVVDGMITAGSLPVIKGKYNIDVALNPLLATLASLTTYITANTTITMDMRLKDDNGEVSDTLTLNISLTPIVNSGAPVMSLSKVGTSVSFADEITISKNTLTAQNERYLLNLKSTATGGITNMNVGITSDNNTINTTLAGMIGNTPLDLADSTNAIVAGLINNGYLSSNIAGVADANLFVNALLDLLSSMIVESTKVTMNLSLKDANGFDNETLVFNVTVPVVNSDAPVISLSKAGTPADFANEITLSKNNLLTTADPYLINLKSTATDGITGMNVSITTDNTTLNTAIAAYSSLDLTDSTNLVVESLIFGGIIQANIAGATDINIFVNGLLSSLVGGHIVEDTKITITLSLEDTNGTDSETLVVNITVPTLE